MREIRDFMLQTVRIKQDAAPLHVRLHHTFEDGVLVEPP